MNQDLAKLYEYIAFKDAIKILVKAWYTTEVADGEKALNNAIDYCVSVYESESAK